jgi:hypothetical protein
VGFVDRLAHRSLTQLAKNRDYAQNPLSGGTIYSIA